MNRKHLLQLIAAAAIVLATGYEASALDFAAGPIQSQGQAKKVCPGVCQRNNMTWNGNWTTGRGNNPKSPGNPSVCGCDPAKK